MRDSGDLPTVIVTIVIVFSLLFTGTIVANHAVTSDPGGDNISTEAALDGTSWTTLGDNVGSNEVVYNSLGNGLRLDSGEFQSSSDVDGLKSKHWGVSIWASINTSSLGDDQALLQVDSSLVLYYNGSASTPTWTAWYYDYTDPQTAAVSVNATGQQSLTNLQVVRDGEALTIAANTTAGETATLDGDSTAARPTNLSNWHGAMEELRIFSETPSSAQQTKLYNQPLEPLPAIDTVLRVYFDQEDSGSVPMYFSGGELETVNASLIDGFAGEEMEGAGIWKDITGQTDYRWDTTGPKIKAADGGSLDGAPIAFVAYGTSSNLNTLVDDWTQAMGMAGVLLLILPLGVVVIYLRASRGGR